MGVGARLLSSDTGKNRNRLPLDPELEVTEDTRMLSGGLVMSPSLRLPRLDTLVNFSREKLWLLPASPLPSTSSRGGDRAAIAAFLCRLSWESVFMITWGQRASTLCARRMLPGVLLVTTNLGTREESS